MSEPTCRVAWFITAHGFGHAARSSAVAEALADRVPGLRLELFTTVPSWFFAESLRVPWVRHPLEVDVGLVQRTALEVDFEATAERLRTLVPFSPRSLAALARRLRARDCRAVVADIAPLGIAAARRARLPSILIENFSWDWIYEGYADRSPELERAAAALREAAAGPDLHLQTAPVCRPLAGAVTTAPVCRRPRSRPAQVRDRLGIPASAPLVLVTMGGIPWRHLELGRLERHPEAFFVVPGAAERLERRGHLIALPHRSTHFHPDLVRASDAVIGKLGYSTVAEAYDAGTRLGFFPRPGFRESPVLARFVTAELPALELDPATADDAGWLESLPALLGLARRPAGRATGAAEAAAALASRLPS